MEPQYAVWNRPNLTIDDFIFDLNIRVFSGKPYLALWTSSLINKDDPKHTTYFTDWAQGTWFDFLQSKRGYVYEVIPADNIKILEIKYIGDKVHYRDKKLGDLGELVITPKPDDDIADVFETDNAIAFSYAKSLGYSAVHLTQEAAMFYHNLPGLEIYGYPKPYKYRKYINFNAWDTESTVWLTPDAIKEIKFIGKYKRK